MLALAARHAVTGIYNARQFTATGGLRSYGASLADAYRRVGIYVGRILRGEKPASRLPRSLALHIKRVMNAIERAVVAPQVEILMMQNDRLQQCHEGADQGGD